jgi:hypothetical protein
MSDEDRIVAIAAEVERYLTQHPEAVDSVEGIARWWRSPAHVDETLTDVQRALELLLERGVVARWPMPDGRYVYGKSP